MRPPEEVTTSTVSHAMAPTSSASRNLASVDRVRGAAWASWILVATLAYLQPLARLMLHASQSELHSYIPLVPFVAGYLLFVRRRILSLPGPWSIRGAVAMVAIAAAALAASVRFGAGLSINDGLALTTLAYACVVAAGGFLFLGSKWMSAAAFPVAFLLFLVPLPDAAVNWLERASVLASADVAAWFFNAAGTPVLREGTLLGLPTIVLSVAQECSGIRSSWVLFITSLMASHLFLESSWRRLILVAFVIPLGVVRNGFRILVIGLLCVHIGPHMIDSSVHRRGGPIFFALSLLPFTAVLVWLRRGERRPKL
jgi:exosortase C (VPDSG-CTERM-specific)